MMYSSADENTMQQGRKAGRGEGHYVVTNDTLLVVMLVVHSVVSLVAEKEA